MRPLIIILTFFFLQVRAQDKLYFRDGKVRNVILVSIAKDVVYFKAAENNEVEQVSREALVMVEEYNGARHLIGKTPVQAKQAAQEAVKRNCLSVEPLAPFTGRLTFAYETLSSNGTIGWVIPVSLSFDPFDRFFSVFGTSINSAKYSYVVGSDLNFYIGQRPNARFFLGPRLRYGTDIVMGNITGLSLQTQFGWRFGRPGGTFVQHLSAGFGFVRILDSPVGPLIDPLMSYGWYSLNYRLGVSW